MSVDPVRRIGEPQSVMVFKNGNLFVSRFEPPENAVQPGETFEVDVRVENGALNAPFNDPDCCGPACGFPGGDAANGYHYDLAVTPEFATSKTRSACIGTTEVGTYKHDYSFEFRAPSELGSYEITLDFDLNNVSDFSTRYVDVQGSNGGGNGGGCTFNSDCPGDEVCIDGSCQPQDGGGDPPPGNGGGDPGGGGGNTIFGYPQEQVFLVGGLVGAGALAFYLSDDDEPQYRAPRRRRR